MLTGQELCSNFAGDMEIKRNYSLLGHNTFGIDVLTDSFAEFSTPEELKLLLNEVKRPLLCVGRGSNLLFIDNYHGTILHSRISSIETLHKDENDVYIKVGSGVVWDDFVSYCTEHDLWGVENLSAIPGEVGASAVQNIGAYGVEVKDVIAQVEAMDLNDGSVHIFSAEQCKYGYRSSIFKTSMTGRYAVLYVTYRLLLKALPKLEYGLLKETVTRMGKPTLVNIRRAVCEIRNSKLPDPTVLGNGGSFFKNPIVTENVYCTIKANYPDVPSFFLPDGMVKIPAGWLIETCGWKGRSLGKAAVHDRQALVLVNLGGAIGTDVKNLADTIIDDVKKRFGITLETEVNYI